jgi:hypothetical protein
MCQRIQHCQFDRFLLPASSAVRQQRKALTIRDLIQTPNMKDEKFEDVVKPAQDATVLVLVY